MPDFSFPDPADLPFQNGLPDPFLKADGTRVARPKEWPEQRSYLKAMLAYYIYGEMPEKPDDVQVELYRQKQVLDGEAECFWYRLSLERGGHNTQIHFNVVIPSSSGAHPLIIKNATSLYYLGTEPIPDRYAGTELAGIEYDETIAAEAIKRGYAVCKFNRGEVSADEADKRDQGVHPLYPEYDWGAIAAWSWTYQLIIDVLESLPSIDEQHIIATGHSRGGKTALCASIYDERISIAVPNSSGMGGTASMRYFEDDVGAPQTIASHKGKRDYWWGPRLSQFADRNEYLPFDAHTMKALIAPRHLMNPHARQDYHANPYGTECTHRVAKSIFEWLGCGDRIAIHWRDGGHAQNIIDWTALLDYCDLVIHNETSGDSRFDIETYPGKALPHHWSLP